MKKNACLIIFLFSLISYSQNEKSNLSTIDTEQIKELVMQFENILKKYYPSNSIEKSYEQYLTDLELQKINPAIIEENASKKLFNELKKTTTFNKIWIEDKSDTSLKSYKINLNGEFYNYLIKNTSNLDVKEGYVEFRKNKNISPFLLVSALKEFLKSSDYKLEVTKNSIAILFYYDIIMQFSN